jgi:hypothetical protein
MPCKSFPLFAAKPKEVFSDGDLPAGAVKLIGAIASDTKNKNITIAHHEHDT